MKSNSTDGLNHTVKGDDPFFLALFRALNSVCPTENKSSWGNDVLYEVGNLPRDLEIRKPQLSRYLNRKQQNARYARIWRSHLFTVSPASYSICSSCSLRKGADAHWKAKNSWKMDQKPWDLQIKLDVSASTYRRDTEVKRPLKWYGTPGKQRQIIKRRTRELGVQNLDHKHFPEI